MTATAGGPAEEAVRAAAMGRSSVGERRGAVLEEAAPEFAVLGLRRASTAAIANRAGISQPYLFKLFGTKEALFVAVLGLAFDRIRDGIRGVPGADPPAREARVGDALFSAREELLVVLQAVAAAPGNPTVRAATRRRLLETYGEVGRVCGLGRAESRTVLARALLRCVTAKLDAPGLDADGP